MRTRLLSFLSLAAFAGCDDGGGASPTLDTDVDKNKPIVELSDDEAQAFCDGAQALAERVATKSRVCTLAAALFAEDSQSCEFFRDECLKAPLETEPSEDEAEEDCAEELKKGLEDCDATVGEVEACTNEAITVLTDVIDGISCAQVPLVSTDGEIPDVLAGIDIASVAACESLEAKCPGLLNEMMSEQMPSPAEPVQPDQ